MWTRQWSSHRKEGMRKWYHHFLESQVSQPLAVRLARPLQSRFVGLSLPMPWRRCLAAYFSAYWRSMAPSGPAMPQVAANSAAYLRLCQIYTNIKLATY